VCDFVAHGKSRQIKIEKEKLRKAVENYGWAKTTGTHRTK